MRVYGPAPAVRVQYDAHTPQEALYLENVWRQRVRACRLVSARLAFEHVLPLDVIRLIADASAPAPVTDAMRRARDGLVMWV